VWVEFDLPAARDLNRLDLYPRSDAGYVGDNFPADFTIDVWNGTAWVTVFTQTGYPHPTTGAAQTFRFANTNTSKVRVVGNNLTVMQFAQIEGYLG
jgi:hypothetical protein